MKPKSSFQLTKPLPGASVGADAFVAGADSKASEASIASKASEFSNLPKTFLIRLTTDQALLIERAYRSGTFKSRKDMVESALFTKLAEWVVPRQ